MKRYKRFGALLLGLLAVLLLPVNAFAADAGSADGDVSLTVSFQDNGTPLIGAGFSIYLVAEADEDGELTVTEPFRPYRVELPKESDEEWRALASTLENYILRDKITPAAAGQTGSSGEVSFPGEDSPLTPGLYLVLGERHVQNGIRYDATPFLVMLPGRDENGGKVPDVTANAKFISSEVPVEPETVTRKVLKVWEDEGYEQQRPKEVVVQLLRDGEVYDTVTLNAENDWRYSWTGLDADSRWMLTEKEMDDYVTVIVREGVTFVVTNTCTEEITDEPPPKTPVTPEKPSLPQTGQLWSPIPVLILNGLLLIVAGLLRRRGAANEK